VRPKYGRRFLEKQSSNFKGFACEHMVPAGFELWRAETEQSADMRFQHDPNVDTESLHD
jgi:hypothetical protein